MADCLRISDGLSRRGEVGHLGERLWGVAALVTTAAALVSGVGAHAQGTSAALDAAPATCAQVACPRAEDDPDGRLRLQRVAAAVSLSACDAGAMSRHFGPWLTEMLALTRLPDATPAQQARMRELQRLSGFEATPWERPASTPGKTRHCSLGLRLSPWAAGGPVNLALVDAMQRLALCEAAEPRRGAHGHFFEHYRLCAPPGGASTLTLSFVSRRLDGLSLSTEE